MSNVIEQTKTTTMLKALQRRVRQHNGLKGVYDGLKGAKTLGEVGINSTKRIGSFHYKMIANASYSFPSILNSILNKRYSRSRRQVLVCTNAFCITRRCLHYYAEYTELFHLNE